MQESRYSIANALDLRLSCTNTIGISMITIFDAHMSCHCCSIQCVCIIYFCIYLSNLHAMMHMSSWMTMLHVGTTLYVLLPRYKILIYFINKIKNYLTISDLLLYSIQYSTPSIVK